MKSIIIYASHHHGNTEKLVKAIKDKYGVELANAEEIKEINLDNYDLIGFASGIDFSKFYPSVIRIAEKIPAGKKVYAVYTCAMDKKSYGEQIKDIAEKKGCTFLGKFGCKGYNTYGPWKIVGGMNRKHPTSKEIDDALQFYHNVCTKAESL